ncbi:hypothetical protein MMC26_004160 [Xylographa opegraphella]|nr:hypothetical protein [Xylographa opegraphella]
MPFAAFTERRIPSHADELHQLVWRALQGRLLGNRSHETERKIKCDKVHPTCGNCRKSKDKCSYDSVASSVAESSSRTAPKRRRTATSSEVPQQVEDEGSSSSENEPPTKTHPPESAVPPDISQRLDRLTALVEQLTRKDSTNFGVSAEKHPQIVSGEPSRRVLPAKAKSTISREASKQSTAPSPSSDASSSGHGEEGDDNIPEPPDASYETTDGEGELTLGHLSLQEDGRSRYVGNTHWAYVAGEIAELNQLLRDQIRYNAPDLSSPTTADFKASKTLGKDTMMPISSLLIDSGFEDNAGRLRPRSNTDDSLRIPASRSPSPSRFAVLTEDLFDGLPTRKQSHVLYRCYVSGVHAIFPLAHLPTLLQWYEDFWSWFETRHLTRAKYRYPAFVSLLYAVLYAGAVSVSRHILDAEFYGESRSSVTERLSTMAIRSLSVLSFLRCPTLPGLMAFLIVHTISCREEEPLIGSLSFSMALRIAEMMGLHREPSKYDVTASYAEARRRVWWHLVWMDSLISNATGWPPLVMAESYWDVCLISELKDTLVGNDDGKRYLEAVDAGEQQPDKADSPFSDSFSSHVSVVYIATQGKHLMTECSRKLIQIQLGVNPIGPKEFKAMRDILRPVEEDFRRRMKRIMNPNLPSENIFSAFESTEAAPISESLLRPWKGIFPEEGLNPERLEYHRKTLMVYHKWARIMLTLLIDKAYCLLYQPFVKNSKSKAWDHLRQTALKYCHNYMKNFLELATNPVFQPFQWAWPGGHQPMHAVMIMLVDLYERPNSDEAELSRSYIDRTFRQAAPEGGITTEEGGIPVQRPLREGGQEAWTMLRRLRERAWQKAGLDPDILWYERTSDDSQSGSPDPTGGGSDLQARNSNPSARPAASSSSASTHSASGFPATNVPGFGAAGARQFVAPIRTNPSMDPYPSARSPVYNPNPRYPPGPAQYNAAYRSPVNPPAVPFTVPATLGHVNPMVAAPTPQWYDAQATPVSAAPTIVTEDAPLNTDDFGQDFDWDQWDSLFGQYAPVDAEDMEVDEGDT